MIQQLRCGDQGINVSQAILWGTALAISDGSYKAVFCTSSTVLYSNDRSKCITLVNAILRHCQAHNTYQAELSSILGSLCHIQLLCTYHNILSRCITLCLDSQQALSVAAGDH